MECVSDEPTVNRARPPSPDIIFQGEQIPEYFCCTRNYGEGNAILVPGMACRTERVILSKFADIHLAGGCAGERTGLPDDGGVHDVHPVFLTGFRLSALAAFKMQGNRAIRFQENSQKKWPENGSPATDLKQLQNCS
jgi:hypothetical protein